MTVRSAFLSQTQTPGVHSHRAFSLVEILIVVVILGILAAIAVPKFSNASQNSREASLREDLRLMRTQFGVYRAQHGDVPPGYPGNDTTQTPLEAVLIAQMTQYTDVNGTVASSADATYKFGPYLNSIPANPINNLATVKMLAAGDSLAADGTTGWLYQPATNTLKANLTTLDSAGDTFDQY